MPISNETANQLLNGKVEAFDVFKDYADKNIDICNDKSQILYRIVNNKNKFDKSFVKIDNYYQYRLSILINIGVDFKESTKKRISSI